MPSDNPEDAALQRQVETLRIECQFMREENAKLRQEIAQQKRWIRDLRETVEALLRPSPTRDPA
jgi:peptidoglycan hydrolase CwlO-like protein